MKKTSYTAANDAEEITYAGIPALGAKGWISGTGAPTVVGNPAQNGFHYINNDTGEYYLKEAGAWVLKGNLHGTVWHSGNGAPAGTLGITDDFYLDVDSGDVYSKASGSWVLVDNLQGPVTYAEEWANKAEDSLISAAAGGDEVDDYSALHHAAKAAASAAAALTSEGNASTSESNAAASAAAAASSAQAGLYINIIDLNFAGSPRAVVEAENGNLIQGNTSGGNLVINLPDSAIVTADMRIAVAKMTGDANTITVNRAGTDTINGGTSYTLTVQYEVVTFVLDDSAGEWIAVGGIAGNIAAINVTYENSTSGLTAANAQAAIDEIDSRLDTAESNISSNDTDIAARLIAANNLSDVGAAPTAFNNIKQPASTSATGVVEKATSAEFQAGTADKYPDMALFAALMTKAVNGHLELPNGMIINWGVESVAAGATDTVTLSQSHTSTATYVALATQDRTTPVGGGTDGCYINRFAAGSVKITNDSGSTLNIFFMTIGY